MTWHLWGAWRHLNVQDGLPVPIHSQRSITEPDRFLFSSVDPSTLMFLTICHRCSICGHRIRRKPRHSMVVFADEAIGQLASSEELTVMYFGDVCTVDSVSGQSYRLMLPVSEGYAHPECVAMSATLCPFIASPEYRYSTASASADVKATQEENGPDPVVEAAKARLPDALRDMDVWDRVGAPSGRKWGVYPDGINYQPDNHAVGQAATVAEIDTPARFETVRPWTPAVGAPVIDDLDDPIPGLVARMSYQATSSLLMLANPDLDPEPGDPCWCPSGKLSKDCHNLNLIPTVVALELIEALSTTQ